MSTPVVVTFEVLDKLSAHVKQMNDTMTGFSKSVTSSFGSITKGLVSVGAAFGVFQGVKFLGDMVQKSINYGDAVTDMARRTGLTTDAVQELSFVAKQTGTSMESLQKSFIMLSKKAYEGDKIFGTLGISLKDNNGILKDSGSLFNESIVKLAGIQNVTERTALAQKLFGKASIEVNGIISQGSERIQELLGQTSKYGLVLDSGMIEKLHDAKEAQELWNQQLTILSARLSVVAGPLIEKWLSGASAITAWIEKQLGIEKSVDITALKIAHLKNEILMYENSLKGHSADDMVDGTMKAQVWIDKVRELKKELKELQKRPGQVVDQDDENALAAAAKHRADVTRKAEKEYQELLKHRSEAEMNTIVFLQNAKEKNEKHDLDVAGKMTKEGEADKVKALKQIKETNEYKARADEKYAEQKRENTANEIQMGGEVFAAFANANKRNAQERKNIARVEALINTAVAITRALPNPFLVAFATAMGIAQQVAISNANFARGGQNIPGTWATVGEQGPERMYIPTGSNIYNNSETRNMSNNQSTVLNVTIHDASGNITEVIRSQLRSGSGDQLVRDLQSKMARSL